MNEIVNPKLQKRLTEISENFPDAVFRWRYVDTPEGLASLPCKMLDYRIERVCNDHSIESVQVKRVAGGDWTALYPDPQLTNNDYE